MVEGGHDLYPGCSLQEDAQLREKWRLESSRLCLQSCVPRRGSASAQRKRHDFLIQTKASSGLVLALLPLHSQKAFSLGYLIGCSQQPQAMCQTTDKFWSREVQQLALVTRQVSGRARTHVLLWSPLWHVDHLISECLLQPVEAPSLSPLVSGMRSPHSRGRSSEHLRGSGIEGSRALTLPDPLASPNISLQLMNC